MTAAFLPGVILITALVAPGGVNSPDEVIRRASRLTQREASELIGRLVTFSLWRFGLSLAVMTLALALGPDR